VYPYHWNIHMVKGLMGSFGYSGPLSEGFVPPSWNAS
jgi:hypothetical protein